MAARPALLWAAVNVPSVAVLWVAADTAVRFTHPLIALFIGLAAFWGASALLDRLTAPLHATTERNN
ncbi:hypothetical protein [Streptomyces sp. NPDC059016]|uniref:hypothetical protein n=1 Tax=Streptomyces sp. NPDC059016 TaxID=3346699 RepID=UPI00369B2C63